MTCNDILSLLKSFAENEITTTVDTVKAGDAERKAEKVAVCFIATPNVIRQAHEWGADLIVTHEPTYHDHRDDFKNEPVNNAKRELIEKTGMTVIRFHDHAHAMKPDIIHKAFMEKLGIGYEIDAERRFVKLDSAFSPKELAVIIEKATKVHHVRIVGNTDFKSSRVALYLGACGDVIMDPVSNDDADIVIGGETCEWKCGEYYRDAGELGMNKAMLLLGHAGSERDGMKAVAELLSEKTDAEVRYFECGEIFSYTE